MPDWFYRTAARPLLFRLPPNGARRLAMGFMGAVGRTPLGLGPALIDLLGHARPAAELRTQLGEFELIGPVGASCWFDGEGRALEAWSRFGFGLIELGPAWHESSSRRPSWDRDDAAGSLIASEPCSLAPEELRARACGETGADVKLAVRIRPSSGADPGRIAEGVRETVRRLEGSFDALVLDLSAAVRDWSGHAWSEFWSELGPELPASGFIVMAPDSEEAVAACVSAGARAWLVESSGRPEADAEARGPAALASLRERLAELRASLPDAHQLLVSGGVHEPQQARELVAAGASVVLLDSGVVFGGPGLPKRTNELLAARTEEPEPLAVPIARQAWVWGLMLGLAMLIGGLLALTIASGSVLLPYDEVFCGLDVEQVRELNPRLLAFMAHDRVTLAGTMLSIGLLYCSLALFGMRRGLRWARSALLVSGGLGFLSFFLFLGFGYFDPFHGFVTVVLFQMFLMALIGEMPPARPCVEPEPVETREWRLGNWGQLLLVLHACGLLGAGLAISTIGMFEVFVPSDLRFLGTTVSELEEASRRLVPLIAHDRATLGGMLLASGAPFLLAALWGLGRGTRWLVASLLAGGVLAYGCAIGVHFVVGYTDFLHLLPAWLGLALLLSGCALSWPWAAASCKSR